MTPGHALDEMVDGRGSLRPAWRGILGAYSALGGGGLRERALRLARAFEEEGVSSLLPSGPGAAPDWTCDPLPLPLSAGEFAGLEAGLAQRAAVLEALLADLHGARTLLAEGVIPPALVFDNPGFLRLAPLPGRAFLHTYAADLLRGPDGAWQILADRTAYAAGAGYALENRRLLSRVLPEAFRPVQVRQLRPFFDRWQDALQQRAPAGKPAATIAVLTPGTGHPHWAEHLVLARELSCALVEAGDLTVRSGAVFLKTLKGLQQIDVLLRRTDPHQLDPLELDSPAASGVPGLLDAARGGALAIVNDPASALAEAPGLLAFLPAVARHLAGTTLLIDCVPTRWLGAADALTAVFRQPGRWLLRPATDGGAACLELAQMEGAARAALLERVAARPWAWVASEQVRASVAPCLSQDSRSELQPRPVVLRLFLVRDAAGWHAMPGGLARVLDTSGGQGGATEAFGRLAARGLSKDVWVLNEDRADLIGPVAHPAPPLRLRRTAGDLPSRVADNLFWLGRYVERLERAARLCRAATARLARGTALLPRELAELDALARCLTEAGFLPPEIAGAGGSAFAPLARGLLGMVGAGGSLRRLFADVARLTEGVRDRLTGDMYGAFTSTLRAARADADAVGQGSDGLGLDGLSHAMVTAIRFSTVVAGVAAETMVRGGGWLFLDLGRRLERAQSVASDLAIALDHPQARTETGLRLALELCDSTITYRARYANVLQPAPVLDLVLADQGNPRGLAFQLAAMHGLLEELVVEGATRERLPAVAAGLLADVEMMVDAVAAADDQATAAAGLPPRIAAVAAAIAALSGRIARRYFALLPAIQTLGWGTEAEPAAGGRAA